ncbi:MAG TPA: hypothetical protein VF708_09825 [Pyrinomonadaceae bacterium]|jgi:hypothetical protein
MSVAHDVSPGLPQPHAHQSPGRGGIISMEALGKLANYAALSEGLNQLA